MKLSERYIFGSMLLSAATMPVAAQAYIGPGAGLSAIGTVIAIIGAFVLLILGFVWYPAKRVLRRIRGTDTDAKADRNLDKSS